MTRLLLAALAGLLLMAGTAHAQAPGSPPEVAVGAPPDSAAGEDGAVWLPVAADWMVGEHRTIHVEKVKTTHEGSVLTHADTSHSVYDVTVEGFTDEGGYLVRWRIAGGDQLDRLGPDEPFPFEDDLLVRVAQEGFLLRLSEYGAFEQVENAPLVRELMGAIVDSVAAMRPEFAEQAATLLNALRSDAYIHGVLLAPATTYYALHGMEYAVGVKDTYTSEVPTALGGAPLPATETVSVAGVDLDEGTFTVELSQSVDPEVFRGLLREMLVMGGAPEERIAELDTLAMEYRSRRRVVVETWTGWVRSLVFEKTVNMPEGRHMERLTIRASGAPPAPMK